MGNQRIILDLIGASFTKDDSWHWRAYFGSFVIRLMGRWPSTPRLAAHLGRPGPAGGETED